MSILFRAQIDYLDAPLKTRLISLPDASGWLFFADEARRSYCYVIGNDGKRYGQNIVLSSNVTDLAVQDNSIIVRKSGKNSINGVLEIYDWHQ